MIRRLLFVLTGLCAMATLLGSLIFCVERWIMIFAISVLIVFAFLFRRELLLRWKVGFLVLVLAALYVHQADFGLVECPIGASKYTIALRKAVYFLSAGYVATFFSSLFASSVIEERDSD